jgi:hypothetical protein
MARSCFAGKILGESMFQGRTNYELAAVLRRLRSCPSLDLINPRIDIFKKGTLRATH